ncbi:MAG: putative DNA binding domain-containing protein [Oscillospiraceae bacterium]|nr:putative DNA binding domain-containing protein [Oscillospiraceae bacterium]
MTLKEILNATEGDHFEFKEAKNNYHFGEAAKYCCALANCGGGRFVLGVSDKRPRKVVGSNAFEQPERTRKGLMEKLRVRVDFQLYEYEGKRVLVFEVASRPVGLPVQADGTAWWRDGDSLVPMPEDIRRDIYFLESDHDFSADVCINALIHDLDQQAISNFRNIWASKKKNERLMVMTDEQILRDCGAVIDDGVTYAALVLFGKQAALRKHLPHAELVFEYRSANAAGPAQQREELPHGFFLFPDRIWELVNLRNDLQHFNVGFIVFDVPTFNELVVREAVLNAVCHRNYQLGGNIFVRQYQDRLTVESPGGFPHGVSVDNILYKQSPRNRRIAEILSLCGLVERAGQGMNLMYEYSIREAKALPDFSHTDKYGVFLTLHGIVIAKGMLALLEKIGNEQLKLFSTDDFLIINALFHQQQLDESLLPRLERLITMGVVEHIGRKKFVLARAFYDVVGKAGVHTRQIGLDRDTNKELIISHLRKSGEKGAPLKELQQVLPGHNRGQIQVLLRELRNDDKIFLRGKTAAAKWFIRIKSD